MGQLSLVDEPQTSGSSPSLVTDEIDDGNPTVVAALPFPERQEADQDLSIFVTPAPLETLRTDPTVLGYLVKDVGSGEPAVWPINREGLRIGRARGNEVQVRDDAGVSRHHASIAFEEGKLYVRDQSSTRGTLVNDEKTNEHELKGGESLQLGETFSTSHWNGHSVIALWSLFSCASDAVPTTTWFVRR